MGYHNEKKYYMVNAPTQAMSNVCYGNGLKSEPSHVFYPTPPQLNTTQPIDPSSSSLLGSIVGAINHISLAVKDAEKSLLFYQSILGANKINRPHELGCNGYWLWLGNIQLHLIHYPDVLPRTYDVNAGTRVNHFSFDCVHFDECERRLISGKIPYKKLFVIADRKRNKGLNQIFFQDPDENWIELCDCRLIDAWIHENSEAFKNSHVGTTNDTHDMEDDDFRPLTCRRLTM